MYPLAAFIISYSMLNDNKCLFSFSVDSILDMIQYRTKKLIRSVGLYFSPCILHDYCNIHNKFVSMEGF